MVWLYCKAWGAHGERILEYNFFWKFHRDNLRAVFFELNFLDPDEVPASNDLHDLLKQKVTKDNKNIIDWSNLIYKASIETIPKCELVIKSDIHQSTIHCKFKLLFSEIELNNHK